MRNLVSSVKCCIAAVIAAVIVLSSYSVPDASADYSTGVGLAAHALKAYNEGWAYVYGGSSPGTVDCSGLICTYNGVGGVRTSMLSSSSESGYVCNGIPNIHGLGLHQPGHVGVYVGGGMAVDARNEYYGVCYQSVYTKSWTSWFKVCGVSYPNTGWVKFQGDSYYYENGEYITNTSREIDGGYYTFDAYGKSDSAPDDSAYLATDYSSVSVSGNYSYQQDEPEDNDSNDNNDYSDYSYTETTQTKSESSESSNKSSNSKTSQSKYTTLYSGYMGKDVEKLQKRLKTLGFFDTDVTDFYGSVTQNAICEFQEAASLAITGVADEDTLKAVYAEDAPTFQFNELTVGDYSNDTLNIQTRLQELGYFYDEPTGYFGEVTAIAVSQFQSANGLYSTGVVDSITSDLIYDESALSNPNKGTISYGMKGDSVKAIQQRLIDLRYLMGSPTEEFDDNTLAALHMYQLRIGAEESDSLTEEQIAELYGSDAPRSPDYDMLQMGYIGNDVKDLQIKLMAVDLYDGLLSGYFDEATCLAVKAAQKRYGLNQTGIVTEQLLEKLASDQLKRNAEVSVEDITVGETVTANALESAEIMSGESVVLKDRGSQNAVKLILLAAIIFMSIAIVIILNKFKKAETMAASKAYIGDPSRREKVIRR